MAKNSSGKYFQSIRQKLIIAVSLMSVIPILISLNYIFPSLLDEAVKKGLNLAVIIAIMLLLPGLGFIIVKQIIDNITRVSRDAKLIAAGDMDRPIEANQDDEIGQLGSALNQITSKIKDNMNELKGYSSYAAQVNLDIQKKVVVLSGLLQISDMITQGAKLEEVMNYCVDKLKGFADSSLGFILSVNDGKFNIEAQSGLDIEKQRQIDFSEHKEALKGLLSEHAPVLVDAKNPNNAYEKFAAAFGVKNLLLNVIFTNKRPVAVLGVGSNLQDFDYQNDDLEMLDIFSKQITVALKSDLLSRRLEKLEIRDTLTGLYNERFIYSRLEEEIQRAITYQRPCSFILISVNNFKEHQSKYGLISSELMLKKIASSLNSVLGSVDRLGRMGDFEFSAVLPEKNKRQAKIMAEEMQKKIEYIFSEEQDAARKPQVSISISENPLDGTSAQELISVAKKNL